MSRRMWTESDREVLRRTYADYPTENIARSLGRSIGQVYQQAQSLGLRKSVEFIANTARERVMRPDHASHATRFQPGLVPDGLSFPIRSAVRCMTCGLMATPCQTDHRPPRPGP